MESKRCGTCRKTLPLTNFARKRAGFSSKCKACTRAYSRAHYLAHKAEYIARARGRKASRRDTNVLRMLDYFQSHPCVDCGEADPVVLQFDHVRGKDRLVSRMILAGVSWPAVLVEIAKCVVRCANCHKRRHARDRRMMRIIADFGLTLSPEPANAAAGNL